MAKGFTVKANAPKTKKVEDDFNLEEAKALAKGKVLAAAKMPTTALVPIGHAQRLTWLTA